MKPWLDSLRFSRALQDVRWLAPGSPRPAQQAAHQIEEEAFERGRREGERLLSEQLIRQRGELLELQNGVLQSLRQLVPQLARECENTLIALALESARKLVAGLPITAELVEAAVREAVAQVEEATEFTILLHAHDLDLLQRANSPLLLNQVGGQQLHFRAGADVTRGGCIVQTRFGTVDAQRETKLEMLKRSLEIHDP